MSSVRVYENDFARTERGSRNANERFLSAVIHAYFDDSKDQRADVVSCGGVLGEAFIMTAVDAMWWEATKHLKKPFHATDCESQFEEFREWKREDCTALITRLVDILSLPYAPVGVVANAVPLALMQTRFPKASAEDAVRLTVRHAIVTMAREARKNNERVKLWFESGPWDAEVLNSYNRLRNLSGWNSNERDRLSGIAFADKSMCLLQAADLIAREGMKVALNYGIRPVRIPVRRLWKYESLMVWGIQCLDMLKNNGGLDNLEAITRMDYRCYPHQRSDDAPPEVFA